MNIPNQKLEDLIEAINHISLNQEDLLSACTEFSKLYFKRNKEHEKDFDKFWDSYFFIEQSCISSREAIVLGLHSLTLAENIDFPFVIDKCINLEAQRYNLREITKNVQELEALNEYFASLRRELFSRIYTQNKPLQKVTEIPSNLLKSRFNQFMTYTFK